MCRKPFIGVVAVGCCESPLRVSLPQESIGPHFRDGRSSETLTSELASSEVQPLSDRFITLDATDKPSRCMDC